MAERGRILKFRTPTRCQNGHFRWYFYEVSFGHCKSFLWADKPCDCPTHEFGEGFGPCGPDQQFTGVVDRDGRQIFEGDILTYPYAVTLRNEHVWPHHEWTVPAEERFMKVVFDGACFWVLDSAHDYSMHHKCGLGWANTKEMTIASHIYAENTIAK